MSKRYIECEAAKEQIRTHIIIGEPKTNVGLNLAIETIDEVPAADVAEVKHGRWHDVYIGITSSFVGTCSVCGMSNDIPPVPLAKYCPNCGAKMDEGQCDV